MRYIVPRVPVILLLGQCDTNNETTELACFTVLQVPMGILESINLEAVDLGESPVRLGGMKVGLPLALHCSAVLLCDAVCILTVPRQMAGTRSASSHTR